MKMKRADEQKQGQHQDEIIIGPGKPRFFPRVRLRWNFEIGARHGSLLTKAAVRRIAE
jgi:hypothetical protein